MSPWYWGILAFVALSRIIELGVSARHRRAMTEEHGASPGRDPIFPLMVFLHAMPFWCIPLEVIALDRPFTPALGVPALMLFLASQVGQGWVLGSLQGYWNAQVMVPPDLEPVTIGPYEYIRHPNYAVVILELLTIPLIHGAWLSALALTALNAFVLYFRIRDEEAQLFQSAAYRERMGPKKRFVPGVF